MTHPALMNALTHQELKWSITVVCSLIIKSRRTVRTRSHSHVKNSRHIRNYMSNITFKQTANARHATFTLQCSSLNMTTAYRCQGAEDADTARHIHTKWSSWSVKLRHTRNMGHLAKRCAWLICVTSACLHAKQRQDRRVEVQGQERGWQTDSLTGDLWHSHSVPVLYESLSLRVGLWVVCTCVCVCVCVCA